MPTDTTNDLAVQARVLEAGYGLRSPLFPLPEDVYAHVEQGETVRAVRALRQHADFDLSLVTAKRMIDELSRNGRKGAFWSV